MASEPTTPARRPSLLGFLTNCIFFVLGILLIAAFGTFLSDRFAPGLIAPAPAAASTAPALPTADTSALERLNAQIRALQAQLNAQQPVVVQQVPPGDAPHSITVQSAPAPEQPAQAAPAEAPAEAPRPMVINHVTSADGTRVTITGSGACAVAAKGARRCGDK